MLHWNPLDDDEIIYNDRKDNQIISVIMNIQSGKKRAPGAAINGLSHKGKYALSLSYGWLGRNISGELRCDFHPRWNRAGEAICFDAIDQKTGAHQVHVAYLDFS